MPDNSRRPGGKTEPSPALEALHQELRSAIDALESGEQWQAWLDFAGKLHRYSFNNVILILTQLPTASQIAGYNTWQSIGRQVRRGEKAIRVLAPIFRTPPMLDATGNPRRTPNGKVDTRRQVVGFRPAPVFDISQTDGPPVTQQTAPQLLAGEAPEGLWKALADEIAERGYRLLRGPADQLDGANGRTKVKEREVWVRDDVDPAQAAKTLAHELAHVMLHIGEDGLIPECRGVIEIEAESVAHLVLGVHQVDTGSYTFPYVANWAYPLAAVEHVPMSDIVARTGARVMKAADQIVTATQAAVDTMRPDPMVPLASRVASAAQETVELRDQAEARALPAVDRALLLGVVADSHAFYRSQVRSSWIPDYLAGRGLGGAESSHHLGYAPARWCALTDHLRTLGYSDDHIEAAGMATRARTGNLIDRMRDRLTVPLRNHRGELVGFSGRIGPDSADPSVPKYLNTPTTAVFTKGEILFGLAEHRGVARDDLPVICEGPLDAIAIDRLASDRRLDLFGVAPCGTAFTRVHAELLASETRGQPLCLAFDADPAGVQATETTWKVITDRGWRVLTVAEIPEGSDPAGLYAADPGRLAAAIADARPAGIVVAERKITTCDFAGNRLREAAAFRDLVGETNRMPRHDRPSYVLRVAELLRIDPPSAAALVAAYNPNIMYDQVTQHSRELGGQFDVTLARTRAMINDPTNDNREQLTIASTR